MKYVDVVNIQIRLAGFKLDMHHIGIYVVSIYIYPNTIFLYSLYISIQSVIGM